MPNRRLACLLPLAVLAACADQPVATPIQPTSAPVLAAVTCRADITTETLTCTRNGPGGAANAAVLTLGGQHYYVRISTFGTTFDSGTDRLSGDVFVQNLLVSAMGTPDGTTPAAEGVRVFFATDPTNGVTINNASGVGSFTAANQAYFQYSGADLGADGILAPEEISASKPWIFDMHGATSFTFSLYVQAVIPDAATPLVHLASIIAGSRNSCGLDPAGAAYCWGSDGFGQLGDGSASVSDRGIPAAVTMPPGVVFQDIDAGVEHVCAVATSGAAYCWGADTFGVLGNGDGTNGTQFTPSLVSAPPGVTFSSVATGWEQSCALIPAGAAYCWGASTWTAPAAMQMPAGVTFLSIRAHDDEACALGSDGAAYCWVAGSLTPTAAPLPPGVTYTRVAVGGGHRCGIGSDGNGYCWGNDNQGQLGNGALSGTQTTPTLVQMPAGVGLTAIALGTYHSCGIGTDGKAYCWGYGAHGELGSFAGFLAHQSSPRAVELPAGVVPTAIEAGDTHSCALSAGGAYCWGYNDFRQVGDGTAGLQYLPVRVAATR